MSDAHPEDVKASIRKRFGSLRAFERQEGLPDKSVSAVLRGVASQRVKGKILDHLIQSGRADLVPALGDDSAGDASLHANHEKAA